MDFLSRVLENKKIGATIRRIADLEEVLSYDNIHAIFLLDGDINMLPMMLKKTTAAKKELLVHMDLLEGIGKDKAGIHLLARMGVSGVVTTKSNLVKYAKEEGLWVIQRLFIVDSESLKTGIKVAGNVKPNAIEILPATVPKYVIDDMKQSLGIPVLGGGLLKSEDDVKEALGKGIDAVSTSLRKLWKMNNLEL